MKLHCAFKLAASSMERCCICMRRPGKIDHRAVVPLKLLARTPRGTTVKEHHSLHSLKGIQFAEQLQAGRRLCCLCVSSMLHWA